MIICIFFAFFHFIYKTKVIRNTGSFFNNFNNIQFETFNLQPNDNFSTKNNYFYVKFGHDVKSSYQFASTCTKTNHNFDITTLDQNTTHNNDLNTTYNNDLNNNQNTTHNNDLNNNQNIDYNNSLDDDLSDDLDNNYQVFDELYS